MNNWFYNGEVFEHPAEEHYGFVYNITNLTTGKQYIGKKLFWANEPSGSGWLVVAITQAKDGSNTVTLRREKSSTSSTTLPTRGASTSFSELSISGFQPLFPKEADVPWTHRVPAADEPRALDDPTAGFDDTPTAVGDPRDRERDE